MWHHCHQDDCPLSIRGCSVEEGSRSNIVVRQIMLSLYTVTHLTWHKKSFYTSTTLRHSCTHVCDCDANHTSPHSKCTCKTLNCFRSFYLTWPRMHAHLRCCTCKHTHTVPCHDHDPVRVLLCLLHQSICSSSSTSGPQSHNFSASIRCMLVLPLKTISYKNAIEQTGFLTMQDFTTLKLLGIQWTHTPSVVNLWAVVQIKEVASPLSSRRQVSLMMGLNADKIHPCDRWKKRGYQPHQLQRTSVKRSLCVCWSTGTSFFFFF